MCVCIHIKIIIETVLSYRTLADVQEHADRFLLTGKQSYYLPTTNGFKCFRGLVLIGRDLKETTDKMMQVNLVEDSNSDLQIMGLCPLSGYHSMVFILRTGETSFEKYTIACNMVPQRLVNGKLTLGHTFGKSCVCPPSQPHLAMTYHPSRLPLHLTRVPHPLPYPPQRPRSQSSRITIQPDFKRARIDPHNHKVTLTLTPNPCSTLNPTLFYANTRAYAP